MILYELRELVCIQSGYCVVESGWNFNFNMNIEL